MTYFTLYVIVYPIIMLLCYLFRRDKLAQRIPFLIIVFFGLIRFDTTTDYSAYVEAFYDIKKNTYDGWFEPGFVFFNQLFTFSNWGYIPMLMVSLLIPYTQIYRILKKEKLLIFGAFVFLVLGLVTRFENIVRQGIAIGIFYYSLQFVFRKEFLKFLLLSIISFFFHSSGIIMIPLYFLIRGLLDKRIKYYISGTILLTYFVLYLADISQIILGFILESLPFYKVYTENFVFGEKTAGVTLLFLTLISWLPSFFLRNEQPNRLINLSIELSWISALGFLIAQDFIVINRIFEYFYLFQIISLSTLLRYLLARYNKLSFGVVIVFLLMINHFRNTKFYYKHYKYQTILSYNCRNNVFYRRYHKWEFENWNMDYGLYRDNKFVLKN